MSSARKKEWLNKYLDSFMAKDATWWASDSDNADSNEDEFQYGTNPLSKDTDLDSRADGAELAINVLGFKSNPLLYD